MLYVKDPPIGIDPATWYASQTREELTIQGKLLTLKKIRPNGRTPVSRKRGKIMGFSRASRLNLLKKFAIWDWDKIYNSIFVTLTYPDELELPDRDSRLIHKQVMQRHIETYLGRHQPCLWRVEYQPRQSGKRIGEYVPHWHVLILGCKFIPYEKINDMWKRTLGFDGYLRTEAKGAKKHNAVWMYIAKYMSKAALDCSLVYAAYHNNHGRHWAVLRPEKIPVCEKIVIPRLTKEQCEFLRGFAGEIIPDMNEFGEQSFSLLGLPALDAYSHFVNNYLDIGQEIVENDRVKGECPDKTVKNHAVPIGKLSGTFSTPSYS